MFGGFVNIYALNDLENGIHSFDQQMAEANGEIEHIIDSYFRDFESGLQILEKRLRKAEEDLKHAEIALECQRNKRVWIEDKNGDGHWEHADCSAEKVRVASCNVVRNRCRMAVTECRQMILDARTKRYIHVEKYSLFKNKVSEAVERMSLIKEKVERHCSIQVPSSFSSSSALSSHSTSAESIVKGTDLSRSRPPMPSGVSHSSKVVPSVLERPRDSQEEWINPVSNSSFTEADRPRSPFGNGERVTRDSVSSLWEGLDKIIDKHKDDKNNE